MADVSRVQLVIAAIGVVLGSSVLSAALNNYFTIQRNSQVDRQTNISTLVSLNTDKLKENYPDAAAFAGLMVDQRLLGPTDVCAFIRYDVYKAQRTTPPQSLDVLNAILGAMKSGEGAKLLSNPDCPVANVEDQGTEKASPPVQPSQTLTCPDGVLYTQFALPEQVPAAKALAEKVNAAVGRTAVTAPQVIANYDSANVVVRYFFKDPAVEAQAQHWEQLLDAVIGGTPDVKYAYIPGYEQAIGPAHELTFELWWPKSAPVVTTDKLKSVSCQRAATS